MSRTGAYTYVRQQGIALSKCLMWATYKQAFPNAVAQRLPQRRVTLVPASFNQLTIMIN